MTHTPGTVQHLNPAALPSNPAFSNVVVVSGAVKTIYIGGQDAVDAAGHIVGPGDIGAQTEQVLRNLQAAVVAGGGSIEQIIKLTIYLVQGQPLQPGFEAFQRIWGQRPNPPLVTMAYVAALARPEFLVEIDAIAVVPEA